MISQKLLIVGGVVAILCALGYALYQGGSLSWQLLGFVLVVGLIVLLSPWAPLKAVEIERLVRPGPYHAGQKLILTISLKLPRFFWAPWLQISDHVPSGLATAPAKFLIFPWFRRAFTMSYEVPQLTRGLYQFDPMTISTGDVLGLAHRTLTQSEPWTLIVWPETTPIHAFGLNSHTWHGDNQAQRMTREESSHLRGIREYVPGDRLSRIHWKTSAHTGDFKVKQFEPYTTPELTVVLDHARHFSPEQWEMAISVAASLLEFTYGLRQKTGLLALDLAEELFEPGIGLTHLTRTLNFLAALPHADAAHLGNPSTMPRNRRSLLITGRDDQILRGPEIFGVINVADHERLQHLGHLSEYLVRRHVLMA